MFKQKSEQFKEVLSTIANSLSTSVEALKKINGRIENSSQSVQKYSQINTRGRVLWKTRAKMKREIVVKTVEKMELF